MRQLEKALFVLGSVLVMISIATCYGGRWYAIRQLPADVREGMEDFDWIGYEWIAAGTGVLLLGIALLCIGGFLRRMRENRVGSSTPAS